MNQLQIFKNTEFGEIRTIEENGKPLFCGSDVAKALGYAKPQNAVAAHCKSVTLKQGNDNLGRPQQMSFITESDIYRLVFSSKMPNAERFTDWVTEEVLPTILKYGMYATDNVISEIMANPEYGIRLLTELKNERGMRKALETENALHKQIIGELQPKANYVDHILNNKGLVTITQIAKDYGMSGKAMNKLLALEEIQFKQSGQWLLYSKYHDKGYTHSKTIEIVRSDGRPDVVMETKFTQKGRLFLYELLKAKNIVPIIEQR